MRPASVPLASQHLSGGVCDHQLDQPKLIGDSAHSAVGVRQSVVDSIEMQSSLAFLDSEVVSAWKLLKFNWSLLACIAGVVLAWLVATRFYVEPSGYVVTFALAALYRRIGLRNALSATHANPRVFLSLIAIGQMSLAIPVMLTLSYAAASINLPLQDARLLAWDRALGFDFKSLLDFTNRHPELIPVLARSYSSITVQMIMAVVLLPIAGYYRRGAEMICAYVLALMATSCISALVPAIGVYHVLGLQASDFPYFEPAGYYDTLRDAPLVRAGVLQELHLTQLVGVCTFPSFHAAAAILYMWSFWPLRWLRPIAIPWNVAMIAATPLGGGHYLVDMLAGVAVSTAAIAVTA